MLQQGLGAVVSQLFDAAILADVLDLLPSGADTPELQQAYESASNSIAKDPLNSGAHFQRAVVCRMKGWHSKALTDLLEVIRIEPNNAQAWLISSEVLANLGYHDKAREARQIAIEVDSDAK